MSFAKGENLYDPPTDRLRWRLVVVDFHFDDQRRCGDRRPPATAQKFTRVLPAFWPAYLMAGTYPPREEFLNTLTHGLGVALSVAGLVLLVVASSLHGNVWHVVSSAVFGVTLVLLYSSSTLYHSFRTERLRVLMQKFDHAAIFLLIAGTYTPFLLVTLRGPWGWSLFGVIWGLALVGVVLKFWFAGRFNVVSTLIYIGMGWLVVVALRPLIAALPTGGLALLVAGGLCYTGGAAFYLWERLPYNHAIWHLFVLAGSVCHWVSVFFYVVPSVG